MRDGESSKVRHVRGIDAGSNSVGFAAVKIDDHGAPLELLTAKSHVHDGGVGPDGGQKRISRKKNRGADRRHRRALAASRRRRKEFDALLGALGYPVPPVEDLSTMDPWGARARLVAEYVRDDQERAELVSLAVRHIARHRGARNPWQPLGRFLSQKHEPSPALTALIEKVRAEGGDVPDGATQAEAVVAWPGQGRVRATRTPKVTERTVKDGKVVVKEKNAKVTPPRLFDGRFMMSDFLIELRRIGQVQGLPEDHVRRLAEHLFDMGNPRESTSKEVGKDPLSKERRTLRASEAFQNYRIATILANLRVATSTGSRSLAQNERASAQKLLATWEQDEAPTWAMVADEIDVDLDDMTGFTDATSDGEQASTMRAPVNTTNQQMRNAPDKVRAWWSADTTDVDMRHALVETLANVKVYNTAALDAVTALMATLDEDDFNGLDKIKLESGRVAYSDTTCAQITRRVLEFGEDLHQARRAVFGVANTWTPPAPRVGEPIGHPVVDRVLAETERWLDAADRKYGPPTVINVEHVRDAFTSTETSTTQKKADESRRKDQEEYNRALAVLVRDHKGLPSTAHVSRHDIKKMGMVARQHNKCLYCGGLITFDTAEVEHIVPRRGVGSTNKATNLVAACEPCNKNKSNTPFAVWVKSTNRPVTMSAVKERIDTWDLSKVYTGQYTDARPGTKNKKTRKTPLDYQHDAYRAQFKKRLDRTTQDTPDERGMESVAYAARELARRIKARYARQGHDVTVNVYQGKITAAARRASGMEGQLRMAGAELGIPTGKTRFDRRHHAIDAATIALMRPGAATVLAEREMLREETLILGNGDTTWKTWTGGDNTGNRIVYQNWCDHMAVLSGLLNTALVDDTIPVTRPLRLTLTGRTAHKDTVQPYDKWPVEREFLPVDILRASTPQLWTALTTQPDYNPSTGLPANPNRTIKVKGRIHASGDTVDLIPLAGRVDPHDPDHDHTKDKISDALTVPVRGGFADASGDIHHARIYTYPKGKTTVAGWVRVLGSDLTRGHYTGNPMHRPLTPDMVSVRYAEAGLRDAIAEGTATYHGWVTTGDELLLEPPTSEGDNEFTRLRAASGHETRWTITGLSDPKRAVLKPTRLASEGAPTDSLATALAKGARIGINDLFMNWSPVIVRRDPLGRERSGTNKSGWAIP